MISIASKRATRALTLVLPALMLAGCFGNGEGPDPIAGTPAPPPPDIPPGFCDPINFEDLCGPFVFTEFEGGPVTIIDNPDVGALNPTDKVARMQKFAAESGLTFGGSTLALPSGMDFTNGEAFTMLVWSSREVPVLFKFEGLGQERTVDHSGSGMWEELCFDFTGTTAGPAATGITFIFDVNVLGDAANDPDNWTFFFDEITQVESCGGGGGAPLALPITFDDAAADYELTDFGGATTTLAADPTDATNTVASTNKAPGAETFAGTTVAEVSGFGAIPFTATETTMTVRVYSPDAGIPVLLKVEDRTDNTVSVETLATTTVANAWETLTFDFSNEAPGTAALNLASTYDKASIFFNFGTDGNTAGDKTYLWDDVTFVTGGGGGGTSVDFEGGSYTFSDFGGAVTAVVANPNSSGINTSTQVAQMQKFAGEVFAGSTLDLGGAVDLAAADSYTMKVLAARSVVVTFKLETGGQETTATYSGSGTWEELCFDFTGIAATVTGITIIFDNGTAGDAANNPTDWTFQFDDIQQLSGSCPVSGPSFTTITFDDPAVTYTATDFGGNSSSITNDPAGGTNQVLQAVKTVAAELWAGTTVSTEANDTVPTIPLDASNTTMTVNVYSPDAGIPVRLKIENASDAAISVETEATTTVANAWETLTFDFANEAQGTAAFNPASTYNRMSIFFNFGTTGADAGEKTYYADDFAVGPGAPPQLALPVTFEDGDAAFYELTDFGNVVTTLVADPTDGTNTVASSNKPPGAEVWGGTTVAEVSGLGAIPFTATNTSMTVRVYSPDAGVPVLLKVEDRTNNTVSVETLATTTVANAWETLTFDFSNEAAGTPALNLASTYDKASIFFNFGTDGNTAGDKTYLWDDVTFVTGGGGSSGFVNGDFETGDFTGWTLTQDPPGGGSITLDSSGQGGRAGTVARLVASGSDVDGFQNVVIGQVALGAGTIVPGDSIDVSFDLYGSLTGAGGVVFVEVIFLNAAGLDEGGRNFVGPAAPYIPTTTWTTHSGTVIAGTAVNGSQWDVSGGVTLELKVACGAVVDGCGVDASFDNVTFTINGP